MQDDSKREERGNRCGGILKGSRDAHTHINTHTHARSLSPLACCAAVTDQTYLSLCVLFVCTFGRQIPSPCGKLLTVLPCTVQRPHSVFFLCMYSIGVYLTLRVQRKNWERKQNAYRTFRPQTSLHYSVYQLQRALWRKNHLSTLCLFAGWHFDTKWRPGTPAGNGERARLTPNVQIPLNPK